MEPGAAIAAHKSELDDKSDKSHEGAKVAVVDA